MTIKPVYEFTDQELFNLFLFAKNTPLNLFAFCSLISSNSEIFRSNTDLFLSQPLTTLPTLAAQKLWDTKIVALRHHASTLSDYLYLDRHPDRETVSKLLTSAASLQPEALRMNISLHAYLSKTFQRARFDLSDTPTQKIFINAKRPAKIAAITKVKNEGSLATLLAEHILDYCDLLIISDGSDDPQRNCPILSDSRVIFIKQCTPFNESQIFDSLFEEARTLGATHILHIDVDERLSTDFSPDCLRRIAQGMHVGECLSVPWRQIWRDRGVNYEINYDQLFATTQHPRLIPPYKDLMYCDDGRAKHRPFQLHCPVAPTGFPIHQIFIDRALLHLEGLAPENVAAKHNRYFAFDYNLNRNETLAYNRYLSNYIRLRHLFDPRKKHKLLRKLGERFPDEYINEFSMRKLKETNSTPLTDVPSAGFTRLHFHLHQ
jgi:hypothetical protein